MSDTKNTHPDHAPLWTATDVAEYLRVSRSWVYERVASGELPVLRFGGHLRFDPAEIAEYARRCRVALTSTVVPLRRP